MQHTNMQQSIQNALVSRDFLLAEKMSIEAIRNNNLSAQLWLYLTEALGFQGYGNIARKTLERAWLLDPNAEWVDKAKKDISKNEKGLERYDIDELLSVRNVSVCAALIVRNEEKHIRNCISHLYDAVDEIVIVDTGSTDKTIEIIKSFKKVKLIEFDWCDDFSAARNAAFPYIVSDWVFWVDADEYLYAEDIECVHVSAALFNDFSIPVLLRVGIVNEYDNNYSMTNYDTIRLFPMKYGLKYSSKIHEQIVITDEKMLINGAIASNPVKIRLRHFGYNQAKISSNGGRAGKVQRNINLLGKMVTEDSKNPLWSFFTGRELFVAGNFNESIQSLKRCIKLAENTTSFGRILDAYTFLIKAYIEVQNFEEAETCCIEAFKIRIDFPDIQYLYALVKFNKASHCYRLAEDYVIRSKQSFNTYRDIVSPDTTIFDWKADLMHGDICLFACKFADAKILYNKAYKRCPDTVKPEIQRKIDYIQDQKIQLSKVSDKASSSST